MKKCFKCGKAKEMSEFYKHSEMADGYLGKCKDCAKKDATEHRNKNIEQIREYDRQRSKLPHRQRLIARTEKKYRKKYPKRYMANYLLTNAVRDNRIKKPKRCSRCGTSRRRILGHHPDYYKPLEVIWVCQPCHKQLHKNNQREVSQ